jgi:hypothetical protein
VTNDQFSALIIRMIRIVEDVRQWIRKYCDCFVEGDPMILEVSAAFWASHSNSGVIES